MAERSAEQDTDQSVPTGRFPVPEGVERLIVFGGTFDPPTTAHVELPLAARHAIGGGWLLYVPAARSPFKSDGPDASDADRVAMLRAALAGRGQVGVSTLELERAKAGEPSYTLVTLEELRGLCAPGCELRLLIGADQAASFHRWREPDRVIGLAEPLVMLRAPLETVGALMDAMRAHWDGAGLEAWRSRVVEVPVMDISATRVRELLGRCAPGGTEPSDLLPEAVLEQIEGRGLYRGGTR